MQTQPTPRYTMYLLQRDANVRGADGRPKLLNIVGRVIRSDEGYRFHPNNASHKASRVAHATMLKCIPAWADKLAHKHGFGDLVSFAELQALLSLPKTNARLAGRKCVEAA